jgi:TatD DNase family protein
MNPQFFDIHSHLNFPDYGSELPDVIQRLKDTNTHTITVGTDFESSKKAVELAQDNENIYACIGIHPVDDANQEWDEESFESLVRHPKVVAVGECGLDFFHADKEKDFDRQKKLFLNQIYFAIKHNKPIMIHSRNAYTDLLDILEPLKKEYGEKLRGDVHFFAGNVSEAKRFIDIGFTLSFTGVITFTKDYDEVIRSLPLDMIMSETDAPFVAPVPYRGKRNEPSYVNEVVKRIAEIRDEDLALVEESLVNNALRMIR